MTNRDYTASFAHNVEVSFEAESIAKELLEQLTNQKFSVVRDNPEYYHVGDLLTADGKGWDVKDDGVIHRTGNVFCETRKHWKSGGHSDGWMVNGQYTYLVILDRVDKNIYVLDFAKLKKIYKSSGCYKTGIDMGDNYTDGFTLKLWKCREQGVLIYEAPYDYDEDFDWYYIKY